MIGADDEFERFFRSSYADLVRSLSPAGDDAAEVVQEAFVEARSLDFLYEETGFMIDGKQYLVITALGRGAPASIRQALAEIGSSLEISAR